MAEKVKKLYRSKKDSKMAGICGGFAKYAEMDSTVVRVLYLLLTIFTGVFPGILAYIIMIFLIPVDPRE